MPSLDITPAHQQQQQQQQQQQVKHNDQKQKIGSDRITGSNCCTMFLYNIPRASLMITLPGLVIVITGAAMVAFADRSQPWTDGLSLIALICIVVGGVMTVGGLIYWFAAWCRHKPPLPQKAKKNSVSPPGDGVDGDNGISMQRVYKYPAGDDSERTATGNDAAAVTDGGIFTVP